jgi:predicted CXXCH cytochrome family protein
MTARWVTTVTLASALVCATRWATGDIEGSKHDFSAQEPFKDDLCGACHVPHREGPADVVPLWEPQADLDRRFGTDEAHNRSRPGGGTLTCLRCHDGTLAPDMRKGTGERPLTSKLHPGLFSAGHESSDHPVGVEYPQLKKGFRPTNVVLAKGGVTLPEGRVECTSCHDPHGQAGAPYMLVMENRRSALCLTCHKK